MEGSRAVTTSVTRVSWLTPAALWTPGRSSWGAAAARPIATHRDINTCTIRIYTQLEKIIANIVLNTIGCEKDKQLKIEAHCWKTPLQRKFETNIPRRNCVVSAQS
jgi:hypothetical protein